MRCQGATALVLAMVSFLLSSSLLQPNIASSAQSQQTSKTITLYPVADSYVDSSNSTFNFGKLNTLRVESWHLPTATRNAYIMFDLSSIPADATVNYVELNLFCWYTWSETSSISIHQTLDGSWREDEITWDNAPDFFPGATDIVVVSQEAVDKQPSYISWNVTADVQLSILMGKRELTEVLAVWDPEYTVEFTLFESREGDNPPRLIVDYTSSGTATTPTSTLTTPRTPTIAGPGYTILTHKIAKIEGGTTIPTDYFSARDKAVYLYFEIDWQSVEDCEKTHFTQRLHDPDGVVGETSLSLYTEVLGAGYAMRSGNLLLFNITSATKFGTWRVEWYEEDKLLFAEKFDIGSTAPRTTTTTTETTAKTTTQTTPATTIASKTETLATTTTETRSATAANILESPTLVILIAVVIVVALGAGGFLLLKRRSTRRGTAPPV